VIALDTNLLVYAHRRDAPLHTAAQASLRQLAEGPDPWALPWPCVHEFLAIVTHPRIFSPPTELARALAQVSAWLDSPTVELLHEGAGYWDRLATLLQQGKIAGPRVHDGRIAALCLHHGVRELWSADRDFSRFPALTVRNPLL
jgi:uncharacterized protein